MIRGVAALGLCSWDRFIVTEHYPGPGEYAIVREQLEQAGGTTANTCAALAKLGVEVLFASYVGDDEEGQRLIESLQQAGCDTSYVVPRAGARSDSGVIVVSGRSPHRDRTIFWIQGTKPVMGDRLPVDELLAREWLLLDVDDVRLRSFMLDLPAHRSPRTRLLGTMTYLVEMHAGMGWQHALRHDVMFGNEREIRTLTETSSLDDAVARAQRDMLGHACRVMYISRGARGSIAIRSGSIAEMPAYAVDVVDSTGAGDAFAAGCIWGLVSQLTDDEILRRGNAVGGLACRALGARAALPARDEVHSFLEARPR